MFERFGHLPNLIQQLLSLFSVTLKKSINEQFSNSAEDFVRLVDISYVKRLVDHILANEVGISADNKCDKVSNDPDTKYYIDKARHLAFENVRATKSDAVFGLVLAQVVDDISFEASKDAVLSPVEKHNPANTAILKGFRLDRDYTEYNFITPNRQGLACSQFCPSDKDVGLPETCIARKLLGTDLIDLKKPLAKCLKKFGAREFFSEMLYFWL